MEAGPRDDDAPSFDISDEPAAGGTALGYVVARRFHFFPTAIGAVGIVWSDRGIAGIQIPARDEATSRETLRRRFPDTEPGEPTDDVAAAIDGIRSLLAGHRTELAHLPLDMSEIPDFERGVYDIIPRVPAGSTITYGEIARRLGDPLLARAVGAALGRNPIPIVVPCHRVLAAGGRSGGFSAPGGVVTKLQLLAIEDAAPGGQPDLFGGPRR